MQSNGPFSSHTGLVGVYVGNQTRQYNPRLTFTLDSYYACHRITTRKRLISGAPVFAINGALHVRHYYHATTKILMAHCAITSMRRSAPLLSDLVMTHHIEVCFFKSFFNIFLNLGSLWLNLGSICLMSSQIALSDQTFRKVTRPHTTPARARLTSQFYPTPAPPHLTSTC